MKITKTFTCVALLALLGSAANLQAGEKAVANPFLGGLSTVASAELPAKAADLVVKASAKDRAQTTTNVVQAAVGLNPAAAPAIVGTIAQTSPDMTLIAFGVAISLVPNQSDVIARVAAAAAPKQAGKIMAANKAAKSSKASSTEVTVVNSPIRSAITPVVNPPYVPPVATPVNLDPGAGGQVPTGGRDYSTP